MGDEARSDECERMGWWERDLGQPMVKDGGFYVLAKPETSYLDDEMSKFFGGAGATAQPHTLLAWRVATSAHIRPFPAICGLMKLIGGLP